MRACITGAVSRTDLVARREPKPAAWPALVVAAVGLLLMACRLVDSGIARALAAHASFDALPADVQGHVHILLLVPFGSLIVVLVRLTLGLRMLGPFRPILIGAAFYQTGVLLGATFMAAVLAIVLVLRPRLEGRMPYFGRLSVLLCTVVLVEVVVLLLGAGLASEDVMRAAVFPIVVLCLTADGFARVLESDGIQQAVWRGVTTIAVAAAISGLGAYQPVRGFLFRFPEFVLIEIAAITMISTWLPLGLLSRWNPIADRVNGPTGEADGNPSPTPSPRGSLPAQEPRPPT